MKNIYQSLLAFCCLYCTTLTAQTNVPANISVSQTWNLAGSPYTISQNTVIDSGVLLSIEPGVKIVSNGLFQLQVKGGVRSVGKIDSLIEMNQVEMTFEQSSMDYQFGNRTGSCFMFTKFTGDGGVNSKTINLKNTSLLVNNCKFIDCYYGIVSQTFNDDTAILEVVASNFENISGNYDFAIMAVGGNNILVVDKCQFNYIYSISSPANFSLTRSDFNHVKSTSGIPLDNAWKRFPAYINIACNTFKNFSGVVFNAYYLDSGTTLNMQDNTFDSSDYFIWFYVGSFTNNFKGQIKNNNFLNSRIYDVKFSGASVRRGKFLNFSMANNYWGTIDTNQIKSQIYDFRTDTGSCFKVNFSPYNSQSNPNCNQTFSVIKPVKKVEVTIYPNPANHMFSVSLSKPQPSEIKLFNLFGQMIGKWTVDEQLTDIPCDNLNPGMYLVTIEQGGVQFSQILIINR